jgi:hypothetical protein
MTDANSLSETREFPQASSAEAPLVRGLDQIAPDPVVIEKIGNGLHDLYDGVRKSALPIYFGPVLGELYLTPLPRRKSA